MILGTVIVGPYAGQKYEAPPQLTSRFPRWRTVILTDENGHKAERDVPERFLNQ